MSRFKEFYTLKIKKENKEFYLVDITPTVYYLPDLGFTTDFNKIGAAFKFDSLEAAVINRTNFLFNYHRFFADEDVTIIKIKKFPCRVTFVEEIPNV